MVLDNIQVVDADRRVKPNEGLVTNSIKERKESYENLIMRTRKLIAQRDAAIYEIEEKVTNDVQVGDNESKIIENHLDEAIKIGNLDKEIYALGIMQGPIEKIGDGKRAIRLIDKMIKNAKTNSDAIYSELDGKTETQPYSNDAAQNEVEVPVEIETPTPIVNVEQIVEDNQDYANESIESAIENETSLGKDEIDAIVSDSLDGVLNENSTEQIEKVEEVSPEEIVDDPVIQEIVNQNMANLIGTEVVNVDDIENSTEVETMPITEVITTPVQEEKMAPIEEYEYRPMTDEEVAISRIKINSDEMPLRDEVVVVPEKEDISEEKDVEYEVENNNPEFVKVDNEEPKDIIISHEEKDKSKDYNDLNFEELTAIITGKEKIVGELIQKRDSVDASIEAVRKINAETVSEEEESEKKRAEIVAEENESEKKRAELDEEKEKQAQELKNMMVERVKALDSETESLTTTIQSKEEEFDSIARDTENRREKINANNKETEERLERITNINQAAAERAEEIARYKEMKAMLSDDNKSQEEIQKIM